MSGRPAVATTARPVAVAATAAGAGWLLYADGGAPDPALVEVVAGLPAEPGHLIVLTGPELHLGRPAVIEEVAATLARLLRDVPRRRRRHAVRLVVPYAAGSSARQLAARLDRPVVAPDGPLWMIPDGSVFVGTDDGPGARRGVWRRVAPDGSEHREGPRYPAPSWQAELGAASGVIDIPAGWWLRPPGAPAPTAEHDAFARPAAADRIVVRVDAGTPTYGVVAALRAPPPALRRDVVLVGDDATAAEVADALGEPVTLDRTGEPGFARLVDFAPGRAPVVRTADPPVTGWLAAAGYDGGGARWPLVPGWEVEAVGAGLWVRPTGPARSAEDARGVPPRADTLLLLVAAPEGDPIGAAVAQLVRRLPAAERGRHRIRYDGGNGYR